MESPFKADLLKGQVALLTGGGSGIGFEISAQLGKHGASVAIMGRRRKVLDDAVSALHSLGIPAVGFEGDVRSRDDARRVVESTVKHFGKLDILVNAAAGNFLAAAEDLSPNGFKTVMDIDSVGTFTMCHEALKYLKKDGPGRSSSSGGLILNISATLHYTASWYQIHVSAAKAAVDALTRNLALEWGTDYDIRVNGIAPGPIGDTAGLSKLLPEEIHNKTREYMPLFKLGEKWDIAMFAVYLASDAAHPHFQVRADFDDILEFFRCLDTEERTVKRLVTEENLRRYGLHTNVVIHPTPPPPMASEKKKMPADIFRAGRDAHRQKTTVPGVPPRPAVALRIEDAPRAEAGQAGSSGTKRGRGSAGDDLPPPKKTAPVIPSAQRKLKKPPSISGGRVRKALELPATSGRTFLAEDPEASKEADQMTGQYIGPLTDFIRSVSHFLEGLENYPSYLQQAMEIPPRSWTRNQQDFLHNVNVDNQIRTGLVLAGRSMTWMCAAMENLNEFRDTVKRAQEATEQEKARLAGLEAEHAKLKRLETEFIKLKGLETEYAKLKQSMKEMRKDLSSSKAKVDELRSSNRQLTDQKEELQEKVDELSTELATLRSQRQETSAEHERMLVSSAVAAFKESAEFDANINSAYVICYQMLALEAKDKHPEVVSFLKESFRDFLKDATLNSDLPTVDPETLGEVSPECYGERPDPTVDPFSTELTPSAMPAPENVPASGVATTSGTAGEAAEGERPGEEGGGEDAGQMEKAP